MKYLIRRETMTQAINDGRIHHQLIPMRVDYETEVKSEILDQLKKAGHTLTDNPGDGGFAAVTAIGALAEPEPFFDRRRVGSVVTLSIENKMQH